MTNKQKISALENLLNMAQNIKVFSASDPDFKNWKYLCIRILRRIYGEDSTEALQIENLKFYYNPGIWVSGTDYSAAHRKCFANDFEQAKGLIKILKKDFEENADDQTEMNNSVHKIFVSHSFKDVEIVEEFVDLLETVGLDSNSIFCSSLSGYGIPLGENFMERIKTELSAADSMVVFMLSDNFYKSPACMCEMGASWIQAKEHIPVLIPPLKFEDLDRTLKITQGFMINDAMKLNEFKDSLIKKFSLEDLSDSVWERKRDRTIKRINEMLAIK